MKKVVYALFFLVLLAACRTDPPPRKAIPREKYIDVLVDVHLAEAMYRDRFRLRADSLKSSPLYLLVLEKHGVSDDQMLQTTAYYSRHQKDYDKIYAEVLTKISLLTEEEQQIEQLIVNPEN